MAAVVPAETDPQAHSGPSTGYPISPPLTNKEISERGKQLLNDQFGMEVKTYLELRDDSTFWGVTAITACLAGAIFTTLIVPFAAASLVVKIILVPLVGYSTIKIVYNLVAQGKCSQRTVCLVNYRNILAEDQAGGFSGVTALGNALGRSANPRQLTLEVFETALKVCGYNYPNYLNSFQNMSPFEAYKFAQGLRAPRLAPLG